MTRLRAKVTARSFIAMAAAIAMTTAPVLSAQAQVVGVNSAVTNKAAIRKGGTTPPVRAVVGQKIALKDTIQTAEASRLQMLLLDGSVFSVGPNAHLTIDRYVYNPDRNTKTIGASVARGAFRFMSGRAKQSTDSAIRTPVATIGIRGTIVEGVVGADAIAIAAREKAVGPSIEGDPATASLIILRGPGPKTQGVSHPGAIEVAANGKTVSMSQPMLAVYIPRPGADPIGPFSISQFGLLSVGNLLFPLSPAALARVEDRLAPEGKGILEQGGETGAIGRSGGVGDLAKSAERSGGGFLSTGLIAGLAAAVGAVLVTTGSGGGNRPVSP